MWGGLLLFIGALLPLILDNGWVLHLSAVLTGMGIGLFIDEVGKVITQTNDYFQPAAASIVYFFFLLTVLLFAYILTRRKSSARSEMYGVLESFKEVLDHNLSTEEYRKLNDSLDQLIEKHESKPLVELAESQKLYLDSNRSRVFPENPIFLRICSALKCFEENYWNVSG